MGKLPVVMFIALALLMQGCFRSVRSEGCQQYLQLVDEVLESGHAISKGQLSFRKGEVLTVKAEPLGETPASFEIREFGGRAVAQSEFVPTTLRYEIPKDGIQIFPITNNGPGSIRITVTACG